MKSECIFYSREKDMNATIDACRFYRNYIDLKECVKCKFKISYNEVKKIVMDKEGIKNTITCDDITKMLKLLVDKSPVDDFVFTFPIFTYNQYNNEEEFLKEMKKVIPVFYSNKPNVELTESQVIVKIKR